MGDRCSARRRGDKGLSRRLFVPVVLGGLIAALVLSPSAQALSAPEVYLQELGASDVPAGGWVPLAGARMRSVDGYEIGVRLQDSGQPGNRQRFLVRVTSVPDGHPDQREVYSLCFSQSGAAGQIVKPDERVRYEGDGAYSLAVTVSTGTDASSNCTAGPTTTGSFTASAPTAVRFVGRLLFLDPSEHHRFSGLRIVPPPGSGGTDVRCARDPRPAAGGTLTGSRVTIRRAAGAAFSPIGLDAEGLFRVTGRWACVARGIGGGVVPGPWSAPTATQIVKKGFYGPPRGATRLSDPRGPTYRLTERLDPLAAGGVLTVTFRRSDRRARRVRVRTRVRRGGLASIRFRLPRLGAGQTTARFVESLSFAGTRLVAARRSFADLVLVVTRAPGGRLDAQFPPPCAPRRC